MSAARPGQVRFEAWVPQSLYDQFRGAIPNRKAWLVAMMMDAVGPHASPRQPPPHVHTRERVGDRFVAGTNVGAWRCPGCGQEW